MNSGAGSNSYNTNSNLTFGSNILTDTWWSAQTFTIPALTMSPPKINGRAGAMINLAADVVDYGELNIQLILDKDWKVYDELYAHFVKRLNVETGEFTLDGTFDLWLELYSGEGKLSKKFNFYRARLVSFGGIDFSTQDSEDSINTLEMSFVFDYFDYDNNFFKERIK